MPMTLEQAEQAGRLAEQLRECDRTITRLEGHIANGDRITDMSAAIKDGDKLFARFDATAEETAALFNGVLTVVQAKRTALLAAVADIENWEPPAPPPSPEHDEGQQDPPSDDPEP